MKTPESELKLKYKSILLTTFKYVIDFLSTHKLRWFVCGGTLLGAIRHNGIIPWDDDVDICMPKDDFDQLLALKHELLKDNYRLLSLTDQGYYYAHCKIINTTTTLWERECYPYITGVFVDIFPIYQTDLSKDKIIERMNTFKSLFVSYTRTIKRIPFNDFLRSLLIDHTRVWREYLINKIYYPPKKSAYHFKQYQQYEKILNQKEGESSICYSAFKYGEKEIMKTSYYDDFIVTPFEYFTVRVPIGYHYYLTQLYGDYMVLPPENERVEEHRELRYYINLKEGLSIREVKRRLKRGEREVF